MFQRMDVCSLVPQILASHKTCCILDRHYADSANYLYIHYDTSMYVFEVQALHVESPMMRKESFFLKSSANMCCFKTVFSEGTDF